MYEIKTADLQFVRDTSKRVIEGLFAKSLDVKEANAVTSATNNVIRSVSTDIKARLALPEILGAEAKLIEAQKVEPEKLEAK